MWEKSQSATCKKKGSLIDKSAITKICIDDFATRKRFLYGTVTAKALGSEDINSYLNGIIRDIEAVKNAIRYDYNNGLAEGSINKIKLYKRIMYGRCSFEVLRHKTLMLEQRKYIN